MGSCESKVVKEVQDFHKKESFGPTFQMVIPAEHFYLSAEFGTFLSKSTGFSSVCCIMLTFHDMLRTKP